MLAFCWDTAERHADLGVETGQYAKDDSLRVPVLISVHSDRVVEKAELEDFETDRRGWWADRYRTRPIGSRLWRLGNAKATDANVALCQTYLEECLQWMIDDGLADAIIAEAEADGDVLKGRVGVVEPGEVAPRFFAAWEATRAT